MAVMTSDYIGVLVPADRMARVIGKAGAGLKQARESSGCKLDVVQNDAYADTRRINLIGTPEQIAGAFRVVAKKAFEEPLVGLPTILVPAEKAGGIVGKAGDNLRRVREESGVNVKVEREPVVDAATENQERYVSFQGELTQLALAVHLVLSNCGPPGAARPGVNVGGTWAYPGAPRAEIPLPPPAPRGLPGSGPPSVLSNVRPPGDDTSQLQLHLEVPNEKLVGALIGKAGAKIKETSAAAGCTCSLSDREENRTKRRRIVLLGTYHQCATAQRMLYAQMQEAAKEVGEPVGEVTVLFLVRVEAAGAVLGKQGSVLGGIREQTQATVKFSREEVNEHRPCSISGSLDVVLAAQQLLAEIVQGVPRAPGGGRKRPASMMDRGPPAADFAAADGYGCGGPNGYGAAAPIADGYGMNAYGGYDPGGGYGQGAPGYGGGGCNGGVYGGGCGYGGFAEHAEPQAKRGRWTVPGERPATPAPAGQTEPQASTTKFLVPGKAAGAVIGKQGATLKTLRETHGVGINLSSREEELWPKDRVVTVSGPQPAREAVVQAVLDLIHQDDPDNFMLKLLVHTKQAGSLIGKQGATLKSIREQTGLTVNLEKEPVGGDRLLSARGQRSPVVQLVGLVLSILENAGNRDASSQPPAAPGYAAQAFPAEGYAGDGYASNGYAGDGYAGQGYAGDGYAGDGYAGEHYAGDGYAGKGYADDGYAGKGYAVDGDYAPGSNTAEYYAGEMANAFA